MGHGRVQQEFYVICSACSESGIFFFLALYLCTLSGARDASGAMYSRRSPVRFVCPYDINTPLWQDTEDLCMAFAPQSLEYEAFME